jgi:acyl carrier protein
MTDFSAGDLRAFVLDHVGTELRAIGMAPADVPDSFDLLTEGVIDSLGLMDLVAALEQRFGVRTDFDDLAADDLTVLGSLCAYIYAQHTARSAS